MWWWFACAVDPPVVTAPDVHSWRDEGALVVDGLETTRRLLAQGQKDAARTFAERVYTERWEPKLEGAERAMGGEAAAIATEYAFGQLLADLEAGVPRDRVEPRILALEEHARTVADAAGRAYPSPGMAPAAASTPPTGEPVRPIVPDVKPAWEEGG